MYIIYKIYGTTTTILVSYQSLFGRFPVTCCLHVEGVAPNCAHPTSHKTLTVHTICRTTHTFSTVRNNNQSVRLNKYLLFVVMSISKTQAPSVGGNIQYCIWHISLPLCCRGCNSRVSMIVEQPQVTF
jgi:hypothetical protein